MVQLELSGYEDGPWIQNSPPSSSSSRLTALREHLTNWSTLNWKEVEISVPQFSTYELGGGVFAIGHGDRVLFVELPSQLRGIESRMWEHGPLEFELHGLTMDREQDLLGLLEWYVLSGEYIYDSADQMLIPLGPIILEEVLSQPFIFEHFLPTSPIHMLRRNLCPCEVVRAFLTVKCMSWRIN